MAPTQVIIMPIRKVDKENEKLDVYAQEVKEVLFNGGIRAKLIHAMSLVLEGDLMNGKSKGYRYVLK